MKHPTAGVQTPRPQGPLARPVWGRTAPYLLAFALPLTTTAFLLSGERAMAAAWVGMLMVFAWLDERLAPVPDEHTAAPSGRPFDGILYVLALLQFVHIGLLVSQVARYGLSAVDSWIAIALVGAGSAYSALVVAHELIHRGRVLPRYLGRALLWTLLYDQFFTEHLRGHHARVGTTDDALAVRPGESFARYVFRSWWAEIRSAFSIEARRLGGPRSLLRSAVMHGIVAELGLALAVTAFGGPAALLAFVAQAGLGYAIISAVNYLQHWGLNREQRKVGEADSWDSTAPLSRCVLLGISLHADHHVHAAQPFPRLRLRTTSPRLPRGYFVMVGLVFFRNAKARALLSEALLRSTAPAEPPEALASELLAAG